MTTLRLVGRLLSARRGSASRPVMYFTLVVTGFRLARHLFTTKERVELAFEVKPGEVYEIRGLRRVRGAGRR